MGESYNGIRAFVDLFVVVKISNKLSGVVAGEQLLYLSSYLVVLVSYIFKKKYQNFSLSFFYPHPQYHGANLCPKLLCS